MSLRASSELPAIAVSFDVRAAQAPAKTALIDRAGALSYEELRILSDRLAHYLLSRGLARGDAVAVMIDGSRWSVVSALAILKAGGAYAPIDPAYPPTRIAAIFDASQAKLVLVQGASRVETPPACVSIDPEAAARHVCPDGPPLGSVDPLDLAYLIHTSGSTGKPKAILQTHRCLANFIEWQVKLSGLGEGRHVLQCASPSFDVSIQEIFYTLISGGCFYLTDSATRRNLHEMARLIFEQEIEVVDLPFSAINILFGAEALLPHVPALRHLISAGETLHVTPALEAFLARNPRVVLHNHYGPAETHMLTSHSLRHGEGVERRPPLGRIIPNVHACLLDEALRPAPHGEVGEIAIGGHGLARGYRDSAMTAARFAPHPFHPGERIYLTGDLGRWRANGELEFLGRRDDQVKIRGYRVELAEVEAALRRAPGVVQGAATARVDATGSLELCAFVNETAADEAHLRAFLLAALPDYMQPARIFHVERLPISPNGKVDRHALGELAEQRIKTRRPPPSGDPIERRIAEIWSDILERPLEASDDLFSMGCDSLKVAKIATRMTQAFGQAIDLRSLFENPTIQSFAQFLRNRNGAAPPLPPILPAADAAVAPASDAQLGLWLFDQRAGADRIAYNFIDGFWFDGPCDPAQIELALRACINRHETLRSTLSLEAGRLVQRVHPVSSATVDVLRPQEEGDPLVVSARIGRALVTRPFDLARGPTTRAVILHFLDSGAMLLLAIHHAFSDARSSEVLLADLRRAYEQITNSAHCELSRLPLQYRDFAVWQAGVVTSAYGDAARSFWRDVLADRPDAASLPPDRASSSLGLPGSSLKEEIAADLVDRLRALSGVNGVTLYVWLLAAFAATLAEWTQRRDLVFATALACRDHPALDDQVGLYANLCLMRLRVEKDASFSELGAQARLLVAQMRTFAFYPFARIVSDVSEARAPGGGPPFEIGFQFIEHDPAREAPEPRHAFTIWADRARNPLWVTIESSPRGISLLVEYHRARYSAERIAAFTGDFVERLERLVRDPDGPARAGAPAFVDAPA
jgi:amino acid adenylation domain-containing protein